MDLQATERRLTELRGIAIGGVNLDAAQTIGICDDLFDALSEVWRLRAAAKQLRAMVIQYAFNGQAETREGCECMKCRTAWIESA